MEETKEKESVYSSEAIKITTAEWQPEPRETERLSPGAKSEPSVGQSLLTQLTALVERARTGRFFSKAEFTQYLKRTWRVWLMAAGLIIGLVVLVAALKQAYRWVRNVQEQRYQQAVATLTPEHLVARCGQPASDKTDDVYPILMRKMSYQASSGETLVFAFSRTAEEKSDWVFLSMKDENGGRRYETPGAQIGAFSCLNSGK
jgi:hypothetical protein